MARERSLNGTSEEAAPKAPGEATPAPPNYPIDSVDRALRLLAMFASRRQVRVADASRQLDVAPSTAHRLMQMLQYHNYTRQDPVSKAYLPGPKLLEIGLSVVSDLDVRSVARPVISRLVSDVLETAHLVELQGADAVYLDSVESPHALRVGARTGMRLPAHTSAAGKVLLAGLDSEQLRSVYPHGQLRGLTSRSITSRTTLEEELRQVRTQGYATNFGESEADVHAVAVPITDPANAVRGALSVSSPPSRLTEAEVDPIVARTFAAARDISDALHEYCSR